MIKTAIAIFLLLFIYSCSTQAPKENEVKDLVKQWYEQQGQIVIDAGQWDVKGVTVLLIERDKQRKDIFNTMSLATGMYHPSPTKGPQQGKNFSDTVRMSLYWNGAKWTTAE